METLWLIINFLTSKKLKPCFGHIRYNWKRSVNQTVSFRSTARTKILTTQNIIFTVDYIKATFKTSLWRLKHSRKIWTHTNDIEISLNFIWNISSTKPIYEWSYFCNTVSHFTHFWRFLNWISFSAAVVRRCARSYLSTVQISHIIYQENCCMFLDPVHWHTQWSHENHLVYAHSLFSQSLRVLHGQALHQGTRAFNWRRN